MRMCVCGMSLRVRWPPMRRHVLRRSFSKPTTALTPLSPAPPGGSSPPSTTAGARACVCDTRVEGAAAGAETAEAVVGGSGERTRHEGNARIASALRASKPHRHPQHGDRNEHDTDSNDAGDGDHARH